MNKNILLALISCIAGACATALVELYGNAIAHSDGLFIIMLFNPGLILAFSDLAEKFSNNVFYFFSSLINAYYYFCILYFFTQEK